MPAELLCYSVGLGKSQEPSEDCWLPLGHYHNDLKYGGELSLSSSDSHLEAGHRDLSCSGGDHCYEELIVEGHLC